MTYTFTNIVGEDLKFSPNLQIFSTEPVTLLGRLTILCRSFKGFAQGNLFIYMTYPYS